jgi:hypothetical protein
VSGALGRRGEGPNPNPTPTPLSLPGGPVPAVVDTEPPGRGPCPCPCPRTGLLLLLAPPTPPAPPPLVGLGLPARWRVGLSPRRVGLRPRPVPAGPLWGDGSLEGAWGAVGKPSSSAAPPLSLSLPLASSPRSRLVVWLAGFVGTRAVLPELSSRRLRSSTSPVSGTATCTASRDVFTRTTNPPILPSTHKC